MLFLIKFCEYIHIQLLNLYYMYEFLFKYECACMLQENKLTTFKVFNQTR